MVLLSTVGQEEATWNSINQIPKGVGEFDGELGDAELLFAHKFHQKFHDGPICFSSDNKTAFITRSFRDNAMKVDNYKTNMLKLFYSEKKDDGKWENSALFI